MNRYSMVFALLVASTFAIHPPQAGDSGAYPEKTNASTAFNPAKSTAVDPTTFLKNFMEKARPDPRQKLGLQVLFASVPHPVETHLAAVFDHNVNGLVDGLQDSGYLFDSAWIPWSHHEWRDDFDDDAKENIVKQNEDITPGILLFRKQDLAKNPNPYANGIIVFLISEKPTEGIALPQVGNALKLLKQFSIEFSGPIRILGPTYSGSFASLIPVIQLLNKEEEKPKGEIRIRSGTVTGGPDAIAAMKTASANLEWPVKIDSGSTEYENQAWIRTATDALKRMGIDPKHIATLSEDESAYGGSIANPCGNPDRLPDSCEDPNETALPKTGNSGNPSDTNYEWSIFYPRDISTLRADYEKQGVLDAATPSQPWKRFLNLKSDEQNDGDSIRSFGGVTTSAAQESILFGISAFLKMHAIRAVLISATNEEDLLFLTRFLHVHNSEVRVVEVGATRVFLRGSTAQFRGDLMVDNFPMLPRLHDWTGGANDLNERVFADDESQGTYFAALDLLAPDEPDVSNWHSEYSQPIWATQGTPVLRPPMYVVALGSEAAWPIDEDSSNQLDIDSPGRFRVAMPFTLFERNPPPAPQSGDSTQIHAGREWKVLFISICIFAVVFAASFWYAKPVSRSGFASFEPSSDWRFWLLKVTIPAAIAGCTFRVLAGAINIPSIASSSDHFYRNCAFWYRCAEWMTFLAPFGIAAAASAKAIINVKPESRIAEEGAESPEDPHRANRVWYCWMAISFLPALVAAVWQLFPGTCPFHKTPYSEVDSILNAYRQMHWESGLSLVPTWLFFLFALLVWTVQAGSGATLFSVALKLPRLARNPRISQERAEIIQSMGRPLPPFKQETKWLWIVWFSMVLLIVLAHFQFPPFAEITTLEPIATTHRVRWAAELIEALILLDVLQFVWLWSELRDLLRTLERESFKRSFVPIEGFDWRKLWSISSTSLLDNRSVLGAERNCVRKLREEVEVEPIARRLGELYWKYNKIDLSGIDSTTFRRDLSDAYGLMAEAGEAADSLLHEWEKTAVQPNIDPNFEALQRGLACQCRQSASEFSEEAEERARLTPRQQAAEELLCMLYIGFSQMVITRLHTLLISLGLMFSLAALGVAIYPFAPLTPFLIMGIGLLLLIGWAFFKIFSEMDRDPILSRIVSGDNRKLQGSFYLRFAEAVALPLLTLGSSFLPGGTSRLLELAQTLLSHGQ